MKYVANPVVVEAYKIILVGTSGSDGTSLLLENEEWVKATPEMTSRMTPKEGDYWVIQIQQDNYVYLNPKAVFERKYTLYHK